MPATSRSYRTSSVDLNVSPEIIKWMHALKGAPMSCLIGLHIAHPRPVGRQWLSLVTDYGYDAITKAMALLVDAYHLAARIGRFESWCLTDSGRQLKLPLFQALDEGDTPRAPIENGFSAFDSSSRSSLLKNNNSILLSTPTTTPGIENGFSVFDSTPAKPPEPLPENLAELFDGLLLGCAHDIAETAMRAALAGEWSAKQIECELTLWVLYVESPLGRGIDLPPARFAAAKIKKLEKSPDFFHRINRNDKHQGTAWNHWEESNRDRIRHAKKLLTEVYDYSFSPLSGW